MGKQKFDTRKWDVFEVTSSNSNTLQSTQIQEKIEDFFKPIAPHFKTGFDEINNKVFRFAILNKVLSKKIKDNKGKEYIQEITGLVESVVPGAGVTWQTAGKPVINPDLTKPVSIAA